MLGVGALVLACLVSGTSLAFRSLANTATHPSYPTLPLLTHTPPTLPHPPHPNLALPHPLYSYPTHTLLSSPNLPLPSYLTLTHPNTTLPLPYPLRIQTYAHDQASSSRAMLSCDSSQLIRHSHILKVNVPNCDIAMLQIMVSKVHPLINKHWFPDILANKITLFKVTKLNQNQSIILTASVQASALSICDAICERRGYVMKKNDPVTNPYLFCNTNIGYFHRIATW